MQTIQFHGASGMVTGSCYQLQSDESNMLVDCGMFQGPEETEVLNREELRFDPSGLTAVLLTHAHLDHCGRLPLLFKHGYRGPVYMTSATEKLVDIALHDSAAIAERKQDEEPLYTTEDVALTMRHTEIVEYHQPFSVDGMQVEYIDAGHILGSASILIKGSSRVLFSGDLGNSPQDLIRPTETFERADTVIMESTYGDRLHESEDINEILAAAVQKMEKSGGTLLIPCFSIQRTQELLHRLNHLIAENKISRSMPIFLDSPMAIKVTEVFKQYPELYNSELQSHDDDPFAFESLHSLMRHKESLRIQNLPGPKVVIAGSGMMTGGRIVHHAKQYLNDPTSAVLFVGYQGLETLGREILEGAKMVKIGNTEIAVAAEVMTITAMSSHADYNQLLAWLGSIKDVKQLFLTHGDDPAREALREKVIRAHEIAVKLPAMYETESFNNA